MMGRNLDKRLEIMFPVNSVKLRKRLYNILKTYFTDNTKAYEMTSDGTYKRKSGKNKKIRAQEIFFNEAVTAAELNKCVKMKFVPLKKPEE